MKIYIFERLLNIFSQHKQHKFPQRWELTSLRCKQIFWNGMILLFSNFSSFFKHNSSPLPSYYEIFDLPNFLSSFSMKDRPFMVEFTGTMLFSKFIEDAWQASNGIKWEIENKGENDLFTLNKEHDNIQEGWQSSKKEREVENEKEEEEATDEIKVFKRDWRLWWAEGMEKVEEREEKKMRKILERNKNVKNRFRFYN
jgi:dDENN domain